MRNSIVIASVVLGIAQAASAQQEPVYPYGAPDQAPVEVQVQDPYGAPPPVAQPPLAQPAPGLPTPGYYYPPPGWAPPIYSYPPPPVYMVRPAVRQRPLACAACVARPEDRARFFSIGLRFGGWGIDQKINGQNVILGGVGIQMRFRTRGRFAMEASFDILHGSFDSQSYAVPVAASGGGSVGGLGGGGGSPATNGGPSFHAGPVTRDSYPLTISALMYIFPNQDRHVFNMYFLGGFGVVPTTMGLTDEFGNSVKQSFGEFEAHLGLGLELRFHWFALQADLRGFSLVRDDTTTAGAYYTGVDGAPVPDHSWGAQGSLGAMFWF